LLTLQTVTPHWASGRKQPTGAARSGKARRRTPASWPLRMYTYGCRLLQTHPNRCSSLECRRRPPGTLCTRTTASRTAPHGNRTWLLHTAYHTMYRPSWDVTIAGPPRCPVWCRLATVPTDPFTTFTRPTGPFLSEWANRETPQNSGTRT